MRKATYVEAEFQALGRGVPFLAIWKNRKTAHIEWHEGSLWDYAKFKEAIDGETMSAELEAPGNATCRRPARERAPSSTEERAAERAASRMNGRDVLEHRGAPLQPGAERNRNRPRRAGRSSFFVATNVRINHP